MRQRSKKLRALVFDLDGTLIDSLALVLSSISHALEPYGAHPTRDIFAKLGGPPERFMVNLLADVRHVPDAVARMDAFHRANHHLIQPFTGAVEFLERVQLGNVKVAIWTGRDRASADELLHRLQLEKYFATCVCGDDLATHKPDPEGLREIMRRLDVTSDETLFVGDADVDVLGGVACEVETVLIRHAREIAAEVSAKACHVAAAPGEAFEWLLQGGWV